MTILLKAAKIIDEDSAFHLQKKDILIENGIISKIEDQINETDCLILDSPNLHVSNGWVDLKANFCDPGFEHKETILSGIETANSGGFTHVAILPSTSPVLDGKSQIEYIYKKSENQSISLHPIGAITEKLKGEALAELYDMHQTGVSNFSDDMRSLSSGIVYRALLYVKNFNGKISLFARNESISKAAQVNEGEASIKTGLKADPEIAEVIDLQRYISLLAYTNSKLHISGISCKKSVELIKNAKEQGLKITADVHVENLLFNEQEVLSFNQNFKLLPVLRSEENRLALVNAVKNGVIDAVVSNHRPNDTEETEVEFDFAAFGNSTLGTFFASLLNKNELSLNEIISILSKRNRKILELKEQKIELGEKADLTVFDPSEIWVLDENTNFSKSKNTPFYQKKLIGKVKAVIHNNKITVIE